jgi:hypothetical protein
VDPSTRLYKGWGLRQPVRVKHGFAGDSVASPPQLAVREGELIILTSQQPGNGWWTAVAQEKCGIVPASYCVSVTVSE